MVIYLDENMPPVLSTALHILQQPLNHKEGINIQVKSVEKGTKDEDWIPMLGSEGAVIISQDRRIHRNKKQRGLCVDVGLGAVFLKTPKKKGLSYWQLVTCMIRNWERIVEIAQEEKPFFYELVASTNRFKELNIGH